MECHKCNKQIEANATQAANAGTQHADGTWTCVPCEEMAAFLDEGPCVKTTKQVVKPKPPKTESNPMCIKCNTCYTGMKCTNCGFTNPLCVSKKKRKKKK